MNNKINHDMRNHNNSNQHFEKQVSHLQGIVGMPHWNFSNPSLEDIREYDRRILEQQAKAFKPKRKSIFKRLFSWIVKSRSNINSVSNTNAMIKTKIKSKTLDTTQDTSTAKNTINVIPECCT